MDFTTSDAYVVESTTGHRMHQDTAPVTTQVSAKDLNMVIWSLMKLLTDAGVTAATFNPADPSTYNRVSAAVQALAGGTDSGTAAVAEHVAQPDPHPQYHTVQGTFTPALLFAGSGTGVAYATRAGQYVQTGKHVTFWLQMRLSSVAGAASGAATISLGTLPAITLNNVALMSVDLMTGLSSDPSVLLIGSTNTMELRQFTSPGSDATDLTKANFTDTTTIYISGDYITP